MNSPVYLKKCKSTNDEIGNFISKEEQALTAIYTFNQTAGRGQYGNSWESPPNLNLAFSVAVPASAFSGRDNFVNFRTAVLLVNFIAKMTNAYAEIKWPNDIIIHNKKVAGILTEKKNIAGDDYFVIGIGLNILQEDFGNLPKAGSLLTQTAVALDPDETAHSLYGEMSQTLQKTFCVDQLMMEVNEKLFRKETISVFQRDGVRQNGIIQNVDSEGFLWVDLENDSLQKFYHKEIELLY